MTIVPMTERRSRLPVAGRIRSGVKGTAANGRVKPVAIETFRFTCRRRDDLDTLAGLYGGTVRPWSDPKSEDKWELISDAGEIRVALPNDPLGDSYYEMWGGKGMARRCDGVTAETPRPGPDGLEWWTGECLCRKQGVRSCKPKLRLNVILPELPFRGTWRFDSGSDQAVDEMPAMVAMLLSLQGEGLTEGLLRLERRQSQGGAHQYIVPALGLSATPVEIMQGQARLAALPSPAGGEQGTSGSVHPALPPASHDHLVARETAGNCGLDADKGGWDLPDDEVVEAEIVDEDDPALEPSPREKARLLRVIRSRAILDGVDPPDSWEAAVDAGLT